MIGLIEIYKLTIYYLSIKNQIIIRNKKYPYSNLILII